MIGSLICPLLRIPSIAIRTLQCPKRNPIYILGHFLERAGNAPPPFQHITRGYYGTWIGLYFSYAGRPNSHRRTRDATAAVNARRVAASPDESRTESEPTPIGSRPSPSNAGAGDTGVGYFSPRPGGRIGQRPSRTVSRRSASRSAREGARSGGQESLGRFPPRGAGAVRQAAATSRSGRRRTNAGDPRRPSGDRPACAGRR